MDYFICNIRVDYTSMELKQTGIYAIENNINNNLYIGSTTDSFRNRFEEHIRRLRLKIHFNSHLQNAYDKYGEDNFKFKILEVVNNKNNMLQVEQKYIDLYGKKQLYNICYIAGNTLGIRQPKDTILKKSKEWVFVSPTDEVFNTINMRKFCRNNNLPQSHMINIANKKQNTRQYKGWISYRKEDFSTDRLIRDRKKMEKTSYELTDPLGNKFVVNNLRKFSMENGLCNSSLINTSCGRGGRTQHKGWKIKKIEK